ncbi:general stress protein [Paracoccus liaowanqingii]|uniref:General stress protein n=1 Tax=Paracoccus liaowanqingii TaxID=2560053 RepID=A0A4Z1BUX7_9RHOB|nr:pyridoxamine 5'-phosphate oxidase family protein [Paracoccus liaowanqingii]TGN59088.1 general stress protein [Paracoccus liaowanqingii]
MTDHADQFWGRLNDTNSGMLGTTDHARLVPMSHYADRDAGILWFITAKGTDLAQTAATGAQPAIHVVSDGGKGLYARIHGTLSLSDDRAKLDELWNAIASSWFEDGKQDLDVQLLRMDLTEAEVWATGGSLSFMFQIAKSKVTGDKPDMGEHYTLNF